MVLYLNNDSLVFIDNHSWLSKGKLSVELWKPSQELYLPKPWNTSSDNDDVWYVVVLEVLNILLESYYNTEGALCANEGSVERNQKGGRPASSFNHIRIIQCWVNQWNLKLTQVSVATRVYVLRKDNSNDTAAVWVSTTGRPQGNALCQMTQKGF